MKIMERVSLVADMALVGGCIGLFAPVVGGCVILGAVAVAIYPLKKMEADMLKEDQEAIKNGN